MFFLAGALLLVGFLIWNYVSAQSARKAKLKADSRNPNLAPVAFLELGRMAIESQDMQEAIEHYTQAARLGSSVACRELAQIYLNRGALNNYFEWELKGAEAGNVISMTNVAGAYKHGQGTLKNIGKSTHWLLRSAEAGNRVSMTKVALAYLEAFGVPENPAEGLAWLYVAEFKKDSEAEKLIKTAEAKLNNSLILMAQDRAKVIMDLMREGRSTSPSSLPGAGSSGVPGQASATKPKHEAKGSGSGAVVSPAGHVVTAAHVVKGISYLEVVTSAGTYPASVLSLDEANDIALLKVDQAFDTHIPVGRSGDMRLGQSVATIGFPNIGIQGHSPKVTQGMISGENGIQNDIRMWQISVPVQPGNSGGPLLDEQGRLIGVVVASLSLRAVQITGSIPQNVNYAIKGAYLEPMFHYHKVPLSAQPALAPASFQDMVASAQKSSVLILCY